MKTQKTSGDRYIDFRQEVTIWGYEHYIRVNLRKKRLYGIVAKWMLKQTCQRLAYAFTKPEATIKEIMLEAGFDSPSNFNRFCKANFQCAPSELLRRYRENPDWFTTPPHTEETKVSD